MISYWDIPAEYEIYRDGQRCTIRSFDDLFGYEPSMSGGSIRLTRGHDILMMDIKTFTRMQVDALTGKMMHTNDKLYVTIDRMLDSA